jgi:hypothetical protein
MYHLPMQQPSKKRYWFMIAGGCLAFILGWVLVIAGVFYWGSAKLMSTVEGQMDPEVRDEKAKEILGITEFPPGYRGGISLSMGIVKSARLTDSADGSGYEARGFHYNESIRTDSSKFDAYFAGRSGNVLEGMALRIRTDEVLGSGTVRVGGRDVSYSLRRGEVSEADDAIPGLVNLIVFDCGDDRDRWAAWFQREPASTPTSDLEMDGSVGDEEALREFLGYLNVCAKR